MQSYIFISSPSKKKNKTVEDTKPVSSKPKLPILSLSTHFCFLFLPGCLHCSSDYSQLSTVLIPKRNTGENRSVILLFFFFKKQFLFASKLIFNKITKYLDKNI